MAALLRRRGAGHGLPPGPHGDGDALRHHRRIVRNMVLVAHQELERVRARRQLEHRLRLAQAEMQVVAVVRDLLAERREFCIHQQVVVARVGLGDQILKKLAC